MGIKAEGPISFKSAESVTDSHQFQTIHRLYNKKLLHCTTFLPAFAFFLWDFSRANNIKKTIKHRYVSLDEFIEFRKTDRFDCEIPYKET